MPASYRPDPLALQTAAQALSQTWQSELAAALLSTDKGDPVYKRIDVQDCILTRDEAAVASAEAVCVGRSAQVSLCASSLAGRALALAGAAL